MSISAFDPKQTSASMRHRLLIAVANDPLNFPHFTVWRIDCGLKNCRPFHQLPPVTFHKVSQLRKVTKETAGNFNSLFGVILNLSFGRSTVIP